MNLNGWIADGDEGFFLLLLLLLYHDDGLLY